MKGHLLLSLFFILLVSACNNDRPEAYTISTEDGLVQVALRKRNDYNELISIYNDSVASTWPLRYPVFAFQHGDINNDGTEDLAVGVIKRTRYDTLVRKRLFLFQLRNKSIIPLWLGSSLSHPLVEFGIIKNEQGETLIRAIEKEPGGQYLIAEYEWYGFGLSLKKYIRRKISLEEAKKFHLH
ncbi:hypothetical protein GCM10009122_54370 [Fulvivirga kasyanovii]|uniref:Nuclear receptor-binding factor 2 n=1 Tax=Fulvivirga kasyanovii TaxID=396812 RepID=A0ABW9RZ38_9BACT|nr:nuclear receptor-binding factor 2 [Fulvivirga kasyanovii]MTI28579.1 nuclear receptor-binding factor 2 [Fulvivirga kasyanovii]